MGNLHSCPFGTFKARFTIKEKDPPINQKEIWTGKKQSYKKIWENKKKSSKKKRNKNKNKSKIKNSKNKNKSTKNLKWSSISNKASKDQNSKLSTPTPSTMLSLSIVPTPRKEQYRQSSTFNLPFQE